MTSAEMPLPTLVERLAYLDDLIFACVCEGVDASILKTRRAEMLWELEQGDHT